MVQTGAVLVLAGIACVGLSGYALYAVIPKEGKPATFWTRTEARSTTLTLVIVTAFVMGGGLFLRGILS